MPPPPPPAPRSGTSFTSAKSAVSILQRRRRKHEDGNSNHYYNNNSNHQNGSTTNGKANGNNNNNGRRSTFQKRLFRGDRRKVLMKSLIACFVLYAWFAVFRFQYTTLDRNYKFSNNIGNSIYSKPTIPIGSKKSGYYDTLFCRADSSSFYQEEKQSSGDPIPSKNSQAKPVFLWGIPSTTSESETGRRELLRKTYLDFFQQLQSDENYQNQKTKDSTTSSSSNATFVENKNLICSFHEWTCNANIRADCQMIYVFFIGGHDSIHPLAEKKDSKRPSKSLLAPPILLNESITDYRDMLLPPEKNLRGWNLREPGTVYLDIRENQFDGKMTTWFKFASLVAKEYNAAHTTSIVSSKIEYVFKVDSDLLLLTPHFFRWFNDVHEEQQQQAQQGITPQTAKSSSHQLPAVQRVYGGIEFPATNCAENFTFDHPCPLPLSGPSYMSGELNFMSVDLATYIASDDCPRDQWTIPHEDVSLSNYVYSYTNNTAYHRREHDLQTRQKSQNRETTIEGKDRSIHIVSVNTSRVLLLPNMRANWETVSIRKNPDLLRSGELLWGHSIKRGNHSQYLYWKKDKKFGMFWRLFYKTYTAGDQKSLPDKPMTKFQSDLRKRVQQKQDEKGKLVGRLLWERKHLQDF